MPPTYSWKEKLDRRSAKVEQSKAAYKRVYQLVSSERVDEATARIYVQSVGPAPNLQIGQGHPVDTTAKLLTIDLEDEAEDGRQWLVTVAWETLTGGGTLNPDPLSRPPEIEWTQELETVGVFKDLSPSPQKIVNSAGQPFDDLPSRERANLVCTYTKYVTPAFFNTTIFPLMDFDAVVNSASFTLDGKTIAAQRARLTIRAPKVIENAVEYYRVTFTITLRRGFPGHETDGWRERYLDRGYYKLIDSAGSVLPIRDKDGNLVEKPWPLDGAGSALGTATADPFVLGPFRMYPEVSFSSLGFT